MAPDDDASDTAARSDAAETSVDPGRQSKRLKIIVSQLPTLWVLLTKIRLTNSSTVQQRQKLPPTHQQREGRY